MGARLSRRRSWLILTLVAFAVTACAATASRASTGAASEPEQTRKGTPRLATSNLDADTQALIARALRVVFLVPFSHWDTDWHRTFADYVRRSDQNILAAIQLAKEFPRFRYTLEQVLFVQHFWDNYPQHRADLTALIQNRQFTFAWAGIVQPETSLAAPAIQVHNLRLGEQWIVEKFGRAYVPRTAWQSDAFGNSAALPIFLRAFGIPYLFLGRWQGIPFGSPYLWHAGCDMDYGNCTSYPHAFYWTSPVVTLKPARVLVAYIWYAAAWDALHNLTDERQQLDALRRIIGAQFARTNSKYVFLPIGSDFADPLPNLPSLVEQWNATDSQTVLVMSDPETAFQYLTTQDLPEIVTDMNPLWQAFYGTRPDAKIADKESEYFLTAADKFGTLLDTFSSRTPSSPQSNAWLTAAISAHYDNIGAVSLDSVWESSQQPRFEQTVVNSANDLASILARLANGVSAPVVIFNPSSWQRSAIVELEGDLPDVRTLPVPVQYLGPHAIAFRAEAVPPIGFVALSAATANVVHPAAISLSDDRVTLSNDLVTVTLDPQHGGAFSSLKREGGVELLAAFGDDVTFITDNGDVYGAAFGAERARESNTAAQIKVLARGPLIARARAFFYLGGQPIAKTVTVRADDPIIEVNLQIAALPQTTAIVQTPTTLAAQSRTDDVGFAAFEHSVDDRPIVPGDITYRREIFYPLTYWSDISANGEGLTLITHGLQGLGGTSRLNLMLVREIAGQGYNVLTDAEYHTLSYAYLPHRGTVREVEAWRVAYEFNQPLIPVWRADQKLVVQLPFTSGIRQFDITPVARTIPSSKSLISAENGIIVDVSREGDQGQALVLDYDPTTPTMIRIRTARTMILDGNPLEMTQIEFK